jgi:hypothetical protein
MIYGGKVTEMTEIFERRLKHLTPTQREWQKEGACELEPARQRGESCVTVLMKLEVARYYLR